ncbi:unnamed protein product, partial [marine sediment metagenome]
MEDEDRNGKGVEDIKTTLEKIEKFLNKLYGAVATYGLPGSGKTLTNVWMLSLRAALGLEIWTNQMGIDGFPVHIVKSDKDLNHALEDNRDGLLYLDELQDEIMDSRNPMGNRNTTRFLALARKHGKIGVGATQFKHMADKRFHE